MVRMGGMKRWGMGVIALGLAGCDGDEEARLFDEYRLYRHDLFATPEECEAAQPPDFFVNCSQDAAFFTDGTVELMVTDIINGGTYGIVDGVVRLEFDASEVGRSWEFEMADDSTLIDEYGNEWRLSASGEEACVELGIDLDRC